MRKSGKFQIVAKEVKLMLTSMAWALLSLLPQGIPEPRYATIKFCPTFFICLFKITSRRDTAYIFIQQMKRIIFILCTSFLMSSCATIFCGSKAKVTFDSDIREPATLTIDGRKHTNITFPYTTKITRGFDETVVKAEMKGHTAEPVIVNKSFNAVSVINLFDILGWGIDAATGAITKPEFKFYQIDFQPTAESENQDQEKE